MRREAIIPLLLAAAALTLLIVVAVIVVFNCMHSPSRICDMIAETKHLYT